MEHDVIKVLQYLTSEDGPNIPYRALALYLGISHGSLGGYIRGQYTPREETRKKIERGTRELIMEIVNEGRWLL